MSYVITHRMGWDDRDPPLSTLNDLLDEFADDQDDAEHGSIAVSHEGGATLEVGRSGHVRAVGAGATDSLPHRGTREGTSTRELVLKLALQSPGARRTAPGVTPGFH